MVRHNAEMVCMEEGLMEEPKNGQSMTLDEYEAVPEDIRLELINGVVKRMQAPSVEHQRIVIGLGFCIKKHIEEKNRACEVFTAPVDVLLTEEENREKPVVVQPDVFVICDKDRIGKQYCYGGPDWVIEVLSPGNSKHDLLVKLNLYLNAGVREYWITDPMTETVFVYQFDAVSGFELRSYRFSESIPAGIYNGELRLCVGDLL